MAAPWSNAWTIGIAHPTSPGMTRLDLAGGRTMETGLGPHRRIVLVQVLPVNFDGEF